MKKTSGLRKLIFAGILSAAVFSSVPAFAASSLYEQVTEEVLAKGIDYKIKHRLTTEGWLDIYVLTADLSNPNIEVEPVNSTTEVGLRETVDKLISENSAVAGVNSAYFGMTGNYSASFGPEISRGDILSMDTDKNLDSNQFGTFFIDEDGNPMFDYFKTSMQFYADGKSYFEFASINKITQMVYPIYFDRNAAENTASLDARFENLVKIVVEDGKITYISQKGETVNVPENGYLVILSSEYADAYISNFAVGQTAEFKITSTFDVDKIKTAISGGGIILNNGQKPADIGEMATGRQPRTLLGLSQDKNTLKLIVVDGKRSNGNNASIGATPDEAIAILQEEGMYYGLNLDGGGSSTMAVKDPETQSVGIVNSPAEGTARAVMSAVGVFDNSPVGNVSSLTVEPSSKSAVPGGTVSFTIWGYDDNLHKLSVPTESIEFTSDDNSGSFSGGSYTYGAADNTTITISYNGVSASCQVKLADVTGISPDQSEISLEEGETKEIRIHALTSDGDNVDITPMVQFSTDFGTMSGNIYTAGQKGSGYITCSYAGNTCYVKVGVGSEEKAVNSFENINYLNFSSYPSDITGIAGLSQKYVSDGAQALGLSYYFKESEETQAAYLEFVDKIKIDGKPTALKLNIYGNGTGQWVRGKIVDANGNESVIDFSRDVSWTGWQDTTAVLPDGLAYPIELTSVYVAALSNQNTEQQVMYFDNLRGLYSNAADVDVPANQSASDAYFNSKEEGYYYINIAGQVSSGNVSDTALYESERSKIHQSLQTNADTAVYAGKSDISSGDSTEVIRWSNGYNVYYKDNITFVNMTAVNGGFKATNWDQWQRFKNDVMMSTNKYVVFIMDTTPSNFSDSMEGDLFKSALKEIEDAGREVMVVSASGTSYWSSVKDGIQYINLPSLWNLDGTVNDDFRILKLRLGGDKLVYKVESIY